MQDLNYQNHPINNPQGKTGANLNASVESLRVNCILSGGSEAKVKQKISKTYEKIGNFRHNSFRGLKRDRN